MIATFCLNYRDPDSTATYDCLGPYSPTADTSGWLWGVPRRYYEDPKPHHYKKRCKRKNKRLGVILDSPREDYHYKYQFQLKDMTTNSLPRYTKPDPSIKHFRIRSNL